MTMKNTKIFSQLTAVLSTNLSTSQTSKHPGELSVSFPADNADIYIGILLIQRPTDHSDSEQASKPGSQSINQPKTTKKFFLSN